MGGIALGGIVRIRILEQPIARGRGVLQKSDDLLFDTICGTYHGSPASTSEAYGILCHTARSAIRFLYVLPLLRSGYLVEHIT